MSRRSSLRIRWGVGGLAGLVVLGLVGGAGGALNTKSATTELDPGEAGAVTAKCKRGATAVSGGFAAPGTDAAFGGPFIAAAESRRVSKRKWKAGAYNAGDAAGDLVAVAYCTDALPKLKAHKVTRTVDPLDNGPTRAKCPKGGEAVSGGFVADANEPLYPFASRRNGDRTWTVQAFNGDPSDALKLTTIAYCTKRHLGLRREVGETFFTEPEANTSATARCDKGFKAVSGGFAGISSGDLFETYPFQSLRSGGQRWAATAATYVDGMDAGARWEVYAYCIKKRELR